MKKTLSKLVILLFCALNVNAQYYSKKGIFKDIVTNSSCRVAQAPANANCVPSRIPLEQGERILGNYLGEERGTADYALGFTDYPGKTFQIGGIFSEDLVKPYVGGQVTKVRFALWQSVGASKVCVYKCVGTSAPELITSEPLDATVVGWNDVTLSTPVVIEDDVAYLFAYEYFQSRNKYPIAVDFAVNPNGAVEEGFVAYGDFEGTGACWESMGTSVGNTLIQAVVKGGSFSDYDISVSQLATYGMYCQKGGEMQYRFMIKNAGNKCPETYGLKMFVDGTPVDAVMTLPEQISPVDQLVEGTFRLPSNVAAGLHTLSVSVDLINGSKPVTDTDDDISSVQFNVYNESFPRTRQLVEHYTSTYCTNCTLGYDVLNILDKKRNDLAWVCLHQDMSQIAKDEYTIPESMDIMKFSCTGYPMASFNRMYVDGQSLALGLGVPSENADAYATTLSEIVDLLNEAYYPAFATVGIKSTYDKASGKINVSVKGEKSADDYSLFVGEDAVLTVYLTEDGLTSKQLTINGGKTETIDEYPHNNVLRLIATNPLGDVVCWSGDTYQNDFQLDAGSSWNVDNMNVVAFISRPVKKNDNTGKFTTRIDEAWVVNANKAAVGSETTGLADTGVTAAESVELARYTVGGQKVNSPVKGLNIVKMSDGRTVKVVVR